MLQPELGDESERVSAKKLCEMAAVDRGARFPRTMRLLRHSEVQLVYKRGKRHFALHMTLFYLPRAEGDAARFGFSVTKHLGGAVERNRIKRRLREAVRLHARQLDAPVDVMINPRKSALNADFMQLEREVEVALGIIGKQCKSRSVRNRD